MMYIFLLLSARKLVNNMTQIPEKNGDKIIF